MNNYKLINEDRILRPVRLGDAEFIVKLRNQPHVMGKVHDTSSDVEKQKKWIADYLRRDNEYYWIIETLDHNPIGTTSLYNFNVDTGDIESGRLVMMRDARINVIASRIQMFDFAFEVLKVKQILCDIVATNLSVIKYTEMCGAQRVSTSMVAGVNGNTIGVIWFAETSERWPANRKRLLHYCHNPSKARIEIES